jgi:Leucine-rich repeat (LRR) protein
MRKLDLTSKTIEQANKALETYAGPQLQELKLTIRKHEGPLFKWDLLKKCTGLRRLDFINCDGITQFPCVLSVLTNLKELHFDAIAEPGQFGVWVLNLKDNYNWDAVPKTLEKLSIRHTNLKRLPVSLFESFPNLKEFDYTPDENTKWDALPKQLEGLSLRGGYLRQLPDALSLFQKLKKLDLGNSLLGNNATGNAHLSVLEPLKELEELYLDANYLEHTDLSVLNRLPKLRKVNLRNSQVTQEQLDELTIETVIH